MLLRQLFDQDTWTYTYLLADPDSREAIIIDPVIGRVERDLKLIAELGLELLYTLDTHVHADHLSAAPYIQQKLNGKIGIGSKITEIQNIYRILYQKKLNNSQAFDIIEAEMVASPERDQILQFIRNSQRGIMKGYFQKN